MLVAGRELVSPSLASSATSAQCPSDELVMLFAVIISIKEQASEGGAS